MSFERSGLGKEARIKSTQIDLRNRNRQSTRRPTTTPVTTPTISVLIFRAGVGTTTSCDARETGNAASASF